MNFLAAARGETVERRPVWIMRQAGRYLPEYRAIREKVEFLELTRTPELAAEVTLQPIRRFGMDAAILFSDIMTPLEGMGIDVAFRGGPWIEDPIRSARDVERITPLDPDAGVPFVLETIDRLVEALPHEVPVIGFAGAPFTLLCYLVDGHGTKSFVRTRAFLREEPAAAREALNRLAEGMATYLAAQARHGARALMLFDSWVGLLDRPTFREFERPAVEHILSSLRDLDVPLLYFPNQGGHLLQEVAGVSADVIGVDWRIPLTEADRQLGSGRYTLQGNLDPSLLFAPGETLDAAVDRVIAEGSALPRGHIFNLGHGIDRSTDPDALARVVDRVHAAKV